MSMRSRPPTDPQRTAYHAPERAPGGQGAPAELASPAASQPIRVISLKAPGAAPEDRLPPKQHQPRLRRLSEVARRARVATPPGGLGYLAPPRDPREARTRRLRDYVLWGSVVVLLASGVTVAVWFLAGA
jgi:hypothetical protein